MAELYANATEFVEPITLAVGVDASATAWAFSGTIPASLRGGTSRWRVDNEFVIATIDAAGAPLTVERAVEGSTATPHLVGAVLRHVMTANFGATLEDHAVRLPAVESGQAALDTRVDDVAASLGAPEAGATLGLPVVATHGQANLFALSDGVMTQATVHTRHRLVTAAPSARLLYRNLGPNPITVKVAVALGVNATRVPVNFSGSRTATIAPGAGVLSDEFALGGLARMMLDAWTHTTVAAGEKWMGNGPTNQWGGEGAEAGVDKADVGVIAAGYSYGVMPSAVIGAERDTTLRSVGLVGDSIVVATQDSATAVPTGGDRGYIARALRTASIPYVMVGQSGTSANDFVNDSAKRLPALLACTHVICEYGTNDILNGSTLATIQARLLTIWGYCSAARVKAYQATVLPRPALTTAQKAVRTSLNAWLRAGAPIDPTTKAAVAIGTANALLTGHTGHPLFGLVDVADLAETARDSNVWRTLAVGTGDTTAGGVTVSNVAVTSGGFAVGQQVTGPGLQAGSVIQAFPTATSFTVQATTTAVTGGAVSAPYSIDGDHPSSQGAIALAAAVDLSFLDVPAAPPFAVEATQPAIWYDATREPGLGDGAQVPQATDLSGNARHAAQATAASRPLWQSYAINGMASYRFDGVDDWLATPAIDLSGTYKLTVFCVARIGAAAAQSLVESSANSATTDGSFYLGTDATGRLQALTGAGGSFNYFLATATSNGATGVFQTVFDRALSTREAQLLINGFRVPGAWATNFNTTTAFGNHAIYLGSRGGTTQRFNGDIGEVLIYDRLLEPDEQAGVLAYLRAKWGI